MDAPVGTRFAAHVTTSLVMLLAACVVGPPHSVGESPAGASDDGPDGAEGSGGEDAATTTATTSGDAEDTWSVADGTAEESGSDDGDPPGGSDPPIIDEACGDDVFDELAPLAHRSNAFRSQDEIDSVSMGNGDRSPEEWQTNYQVLYDEEWGAAVFHVDEDTNGTDLITDLYPRLDFDGPPTDTRWVVSWMTRWGPNWLSEAHKGPDRSWRNSKHVHLRGRDDQEPDGDGALKQNISFMRPEARRDPDELFREFGETRAGYLGPNATDAAPIQPSSFAEFPIRVERWVRHVMIIEEGAPFGSITSWLVDTERDAVRVIDDVDYRVPWSTQLGVGFTNAQIFLNPKPARSEGPPVKLGFKNFVVLRNPSDDQIEVLLQRPQCD